MDLVVHFPTADIKRNLGQNDSTARWLDESARHERVANEDRFFDRRRGVDRPVQETALRRWGTKSQNVRSEPIKNSQNLPLYYLVYASKNDRGDKIWQSITKNAPSGQRGLRLLSARGQA